MMNDAKKINIPCFPDLLFDFDTILPFYDLKKIFFLLETWHKKIF